MLTMIINLISWLSLFRFYDCQVKDDRVSIFMPHTHTQITWPPTQSLRPPRLLIHHADSQNTKKQQQEAARGSPVYFSAGREAGPLESSSPGPPAQGCKPD